MRTSSTLGCWLSPMVARVWEPVGHPRQASKCPRATRTLLLTGMVGEPTLDARHGMVASKGPLLPPPYQCFALCYAMCR